MNKRTIAVILVVLAVALVSAFAFKQRQEVSLTDSSGYLLSKVYNSTSELVDFSNVILKGKISKEPRQEQLAELVFHVYDVEVEKLYDNQTEQNITAGDTVEVYRIIGYAPGDIHEMASLVAPEYQQLEQGEYLLFLNGGYDEEGDKHILIPNSPEQLYKAKEAEGFPWLKPAGERFDSISPQEQLPTIYESDLFLAIGKSLLINSRNK
ncbi:hypothetical protein [Brevibacillus parabrevis]|uniref:hypothetical protein n=1 Tax=Brevibacillus parabrevis TaxID=54914 RepID=UPI0011342C9F|nr:hypothetical protein [Brevibacillus parabrevis]TGV08284.1 hypothetical protein EN829_051780 [Mesorhizobium sp. M00.F.Ca.ET.186.01.1.1]